MILCSEEEAEKRHGLLEQPYRRHLLRSYVNRHNGRSRVIKMAIIAEAAWGLPTCNRDKNQDTSMSYRCH